MPLVQAQPKKIRSANIHVIGLCNYRCEHCFDRCLTHKYLAPEEWMPVLNYLRDSGIEKVNIANQGIRDIKPLANKIHLTELWL